MTHAYRCADLFWMRSAGFPFEWLDHLQVLADHPGLARCESLIDQIHGAEQSLLGRIEQVAPSALPKLRRKFAEGADLKVSELPANVREETQEAFESRSSALVSLKEASASLSEAFSQHQANTRKHLVEALSRQDAREALFLSNPDALKRIDALIESFSVPEPQLDSRARQRLRLGWNYLQRFCAKNDTSSFFGPITWGRIDRSLSQALHLEAPPGHWLAQRKTFFEHWVVLRLSQAICADPRLSDALPMALSPGCDLRRDTLHYPLGKAKPLNGAALGLIQALHGSAPTGLNRITIRSRLEPLGYSWKECQDLMAFFLDKRVLQYTLEVPTGQTRNCEPIHQLRAQIDGLEAPQEAIKPWLTLIDQLEMQRQRFASGDLETRRIALDAMNALLTDRGIDLSRAQGQMYVGRFPVYEDCSRNLNVRLASTLAEDLERPMQPVMRLYRWLAGAIAVRVHDHYLSLWHDLRRDTDRVDFLEFFQEVQRHSNLESIVKELRGVLKSSWAGLVQPHLEQHQSPDEIRLSGQDLEELLQALRDHEPRADDFPGMAWGIHSPDFMLAAKDPEAVARGDYAWIIGEVHPAVHTLSQPVAQPFCPDPGRLRDEVSRLLQPGTAVVADSSETYQRSHIDWLEVDSLRQVVLPGSVGRVHHDRCLPAGRGVVVIDRYGSQEVLTFKDTLTGVKQDILTVMPSEVHRACFALAADLIGVSLSPRLVFEKWVLKRRAWEATTEQTPGLGHPAEDVRSFLAWRQWARRHDMPRHVFVKLAEEPKPIYVDFSNPLSIDLLAHLCKTPQTLRISEMRPSPDELWLRDARGRYCSEFRTSFAASESAQRPSLPTDSHAT